MDEELRRTLEMAISANAKATGLLEETARIFDATGAMTAPLAQLATNLALAMHESGILKSERAQDAAKCLREMSGLLDAMAGDDRMPPGLASKMHSAAQIIQPRD